MSEDHRPQVHATSIEGFALCAENWRRRFIEGERRPKGLSAHAGQGVDLSVKANLRHIMEAGESLPVEQIESIARDGFTVSLDREGALYLPDEIELGAEKANGAAIDKAVRLSVLHAQELAPKLRPTHLDWSWSLEIEGASFDLVGTADIREAGMIRDVKSTGKSPDKTGAETSLQLTTYAMAVAAIDGEETSRVALDTLVDLKTPKLVVLESTRSAEDFGSVLSRLEVIEAAKAAGLFPPASAGHWKCSANYCEYFSDCRYVRRPVSISVPGGAK